MVPDDDDDNDDDDGDNAKANDYDKQCLFFVDGDDTWDGNGCDVECKVLSFSDIQVWQAD